MYLMSLFKIPKGVLKNWTTTDRGSFGAVKDIKINIDLLDGIS
jgi:hypothetical protein